MEDDGTAAKQKQWLSEDAGSFGAPNFHGYQPVVTTRRGARPGPPLVVPNFQTFHGQTDQTTGQRDAT